MIKINEKLRKAFQKSGGRQYSDTDWLQHIYGGSDKMRFQYCMNSNNYSLFFRAIQGHTDGNLMAPELMGHVAVPHKWKEFLFLRGCSSSSLEDEKAKKEDRPSSSHLSTRLGTIQTLKDLAMTYQNRESTLLQ